MKNDLSSALFGGTKKALLTLLLTHEDETFYLRQITRELKAGSGVVQRELALLVGAGILERRPKGRQFFYQADRLSPVFKELRSILVKIK